jgi:ribonuclease I
MMVVYGLQITLTEIRICLSKNFEATQCSGGGGGGGRLGRSKKKYPKIYTIACGRKGSKIFYAPAQ